MSPRELRSGSSDLPPADYIEETRRLYDSLGYDAYRWAESEEPTPWQPIEKPLRGSRIAIVGSGGVYRHGQVAFHTKDDTSIRIITDEATGDDLRVAHFAYDQADARNDPNCVFPLDRLRELVDEGIVGGLSRHHFGFMGGIYSTRRLMAETAVLLTEELSKLHQNGDIDVVLLVPV